MLPSHASAARSPLHAEEGGAPNVESLSWSTDVMEGVSDINGEELFVQGREFKVGHRAPELSQGVHVDKADLPEAGQLGQQAVEGAHITLIRQLMGLPQLIA